MQVLPRLFKLLPCVDLDTFYAKVKFGDKGFCMGKSENIFFLESVAALGLKAAWSIQLNELMKLSEYQRSRSFVDLGQRSLRFQSQIFDFWSVYSGEHFRASWPSCFYYLGAWLLALYKITVTYFYKNWHHDWFDLKVGSYSSDWIIILLIYIYFFLNCLKAIVTRKLRSFTKKYKVKSIKYRRTSMARTLIALFLSPLEKIP